jgi:hypothetical protein
LSSAIADADPLRFVVGQAATLKYALTATLITLIHRKNYATATMQFEELVALTDEKGSSF